MGVLKVHMVHLYGAYPENLLKQVWKLPGLRTAGYKREREREREMAYKCLNPAAIG